MAEGVALAIDTSLAIRRRFQPRLDHVRIFYDQHIEGLRSGKVAGTAEAWIHDIHLNPAYATAGQAEVLAATPKKARTVHILLPPYTWIDSVVAHEHWHQLEFSFEGDSYRQSVEFRRAIGAYFGVETLEHVIKGASAGAPDAWRAAHHRLVNEVSAYAATNPKEATAELFTQWWCTSRSRPPCARYFGDILRRFFPQADLTDHL